LNEVFCGPAQAIEPPHYQHVTIPQMVEGLFEFWAIGSSARLFLTKDFLTTILAQTLLLCV
jgi:hypothetical protein